MREKSISTKIERIPARTYRGRVAATTATAEVRARGRSVGDVPESKGERARVRQKVWEA